jgi:hypothetical protein
MEDHSLHLHWMARKAISMNEIVALPSRMELSKFDPVVLAAQHKA